MGIILLLVLAAGVVVGALVDLVVLMVGLPLLLARFRRAQSRPPWGRLTLTLLICTGLGFWVAGEIPYGTVRPGNDYEIAAANLFKSGIAYTLAPGVALLVTILLGLTAWRPQPTAPVEPEGRGAMPSCELE